MKEIYESVPDQDSTDDLCTTPTWPEPRQVRGQWSLQSKVITAVNAMFFLTSCGVLLVSSRWLNDPVHLMKRVSPYSPILDDVPIQLETVEVKGTLFNDYTPPRIWREQPSEEVDKAWDDMARIEYFGVSGDALRKMGKDPEISVSIPEEWGVGSDKYLVEIDMQHQLHCLNAVRKYAYFDYYYGNDYKNISMAPQRHQAHLAHCIDILLQALTCNPSLDLISHNWMRTQQNPYPDFNIKRQCVAHDPILKWQHENGISEQILKYKNLPRPEGFPEVEPEPSILKIGEDLGHHEGHLRL
ncbi:tat pathway signal sequence [Colletotrichum scovillei]|uniref:Tat pathway signal sequence n=1 Tax=Colletotrichum scovillei TaxID=1209932 RepID=A0A9P7REF9_9PEZI|nr:tat pathway signal sequence [Colletotrichum scovillei]KAG7075217.1 tat pathway signal sequence [Colletotrichum scovillei]KAG7082248.1 tat pathway signal sequence [Colletotrichum scovillei]